MDNLQQTVAIVPYKPEFIKIVKDMHISQRYKGVKHINNETLPKIGFIATVFDQPVAAGFLRMVEGGFAQIDTLVTYAKIPSATRHAALTVLVNHLTATARHMKLKGLVAFTMSPDVLSRAHKQGWTATQDTMITLKLT